MEGKRVKKLKRIVSIFIALCMVFTVNAFAFAEEATTVSEALDYNKKGSITVDIFSTDTGKAIPDGTVTLYKVASAVQSDGNNIFQLTEGFEGSGVDLDGISESDSGARELASVLETYANSKKISGEAVTVDKNGQASWQGLDLGIYLIVNTSAAEGYAPVSSFLITVPRYLNGSYVYDVTARPKLGTADKTASETPKSNALTGKLPQTGQLWWPVPILAIAGILFVLLGWYRERRFGEENNGYE